MAKKTDLVAAASRRYARALQNHASALERGDEAAIERAAKEVDESRARLEKLVSPWRPLVGAAGGGAAGGALGAAVGGPLGAAIGGGLAAAGGAYLTTPTAAAAPTTGSRDTGLGFGRPSPAFSKETKQLKNKLLR